MKQVKRIKKPTYAGGGEIPYGTMLQTLAQLSANGAYTSQGAPNVGSMTASSALSGAGTGFALGNAVFPGIGGAVGAVGGAVLGGISGNKKAKKQEEEYLQQKRRSDAFEQNIEDAQRASFMKMYPSQGRDYSSLFSLGGDIYAKGGNIQQVVNGYMKHLAPGVTKVKGKKHGAGGVDLITTGRGPIEVEGDEVIKDERQVFSDRTRVPGSRRTYAEMAERISRTPEYIKQAKKQKKLEQIVDDPRNNQYRMGTAARKLELIINPLDRLFNLQEQQKQSMKVRTAGPRKAAYGMDMAEPEPFAANIKWLRDRFLNQVGTKLSGDPAANTRNALMGPLGANVGARVQVPNVMQVPMQSRATASAVAEGVGDRMGALPDRAQAMTRNSAEALLPNMTPGPLGGVPSARNAMMNRMLAQKDKVPELVDKYGAKVLAGARSFSGIGGPPGEDPASSTKPRKPDLMNAMGQAAPYLDNLVNMMITNKTPQIPAPTRVQAPVLETNFNINPQLADINRTAAARNRMLTANTSNPQVARANMIAGYSNDINARNQLQGQKANVETDLRNKQQMIDYDVNRTNAQQLDDFKRMKMLRMDDIHKRQSTNAANLSEDIQYQNFEKNLKTRDQQQLAMLAAQYAESGVLERADFFDIQQQIEDGVPLEEIRRQINEKRKKK